MRLPAWDELIKEQLDVMDFPLNKSLFVAGPPGSGKTVLAIRRAGAAAGSRNSKVILVTFNRMLRRLATLLSEGSSNCRTMHSFAYRDFKKKIGVPPGSIGSNSFNYNWQGMIARLRGQPNSAPIWDHVVVDEGQDLPEGFFMYLYEHGANVLTVFADEDQALSEKKTRLSEIRAAARLPNPILLKENHRNSPEIALVAEHYHSGILPAAMTRRSATGQLPRLIQKNIHDAAEFIAVWFENRGGTVGIIVNRNSIGDLIHQELSNLLPQARVDIYTSGRSNEEGIALLEEGVTILNKESVKGQEFDSVFILELERFIPCMNGSMKRAMYMSCARARDYLFLVHGAELSSAAKLDLPGPNLLERG